MSDIFDLFKKIEKPKADMGPVTHIVVGLGNPGEKYGRTRHNVGFMSTNYISEKLGIKINNSRFKALCADCIVEGKRVLFMQPQTFMNNSGEAVKAAADFYKIPPENIIVIFDDISLPPGKMRIRKSGSAGGHNGIKSIIYHLNSDNFPRIKIGVGEKPNPEYDLADWVLGVFSENDRQAVFSCIEKSYYAMLLMLKGETEKAMGTFN